MPDPVRKKIVWWSAAYIAVVTGSIVQAFDFAGAHNGFWLIVVLVLTLPRSLLSVHFAWSLAHEAGLGRFVVFYLACAGLNVFMANKLRLYIGKRRG